MHDSPFAESVLCRGYSYRVEAEEQEADRRRQPSEWCICVSVQIHKDAKVDPSLGLSESVGWIWPCYEDCEGGSDSDYHSNVSCRVVEANLDEKEFGHHGVDKTCDRSTCRQIGRRVSMYPMN